ncbi:hypothetical protein GSF08_09675 [Clostridiaceae bacterium DONG20-135]|uniref:Uncharacterized protein n=1 Tax=Copranaerobaculum intestinale TaxID=2692629 RepID=A0A6N8UA44_9FIRM|nr:hypothetical protein [Copranaerobaculum intestinale]MXQ74204.1 hypothetical protein [Copranaerobaculum intestinale]
MARKYDLVERLKTANERPFLVLDEEHVYTINTSKNNVIAMMAMMDEYERNSEGNPNHSQLEMMDKMITMALGKAGAEYIASREDWTFDALQDVVKSISAAIANISIEEVEKRSNQAGKKK